MASKNRTRQAPSISTSKDVAQLSRLVSEKPRAPQKLPAKPTPVPAPRAAPPILVSRPVRLASKPARPLPANVQEMLTQAQSMQAEGSGQPEILEWVKKCAAAHCVKVYNDSYPAFSWTVPGPAESKDADAAPAVTLAEPEKPKTPDAAPAAPKEPDAAPAAPKEPDAMPAAPKEPGAMPAAPEGSDAVPKEPDAGLVPAEKVAEASEAKQSEDKKPGEDLVVRKEGRGARRTRNKKTKLVVRVDRMADGSHSMRLGAADVAARNTQLMTTCRVILCLEKGRASSQRSQFFWESNGFVIDARDWRPLVVPPRAFSLQPPTRVVDPLIARGEYSAVRADDGTVVTFYHWVHPTDGPRWTLATSGGYDVSTYKWFGRLTYAKIFFQSAKRYPSFAVGLRLEGSQLQHDTLDRARCYTVGLRHHNFHPLRVDPERMWQVQSARLGAVYERDPVGALPGVPAQVAVDISRYSSMAELRRSGEEALSQAKAYIAGLNDAEGKTAGGAENGPPARLNYGIILRANDGAAAEGHTDILVDTPLLVTLRKLLYEKIPIEHDSEVDYADRLAYNALRAFQGSETRDSFLALFPAWSAYHAKYEALIKETAEGVVAAARQHKQGNASRALDLKGAAGAIARGVLQYQRKDLADLRVREAESIARDHLTVPAHTVLFLRALGGWAEPSAEPSAEPGAEPSAE